jgi:lipid-A-disaccharide synthase
VGLELLAHGKPSVVVYRVSRPELRLCRLLKTSPYISLVNLLAGKELFPEFLTDRCAAEAVAGHVLRWLNDPAAHAALCRELAELRGRVGEPGACERAARYILDVLGQPGTPRARRVA